MFSPAMLPLATWFPTVSGLGIISKNFRRGALSKTLFVLFLTPDYA
jgi:hypothetical protein